MEKKVKIVIGASSWWKNLKYRNEAAKKLRKIKKNWRLRKKEICKTSKFKIDTKIYKNYYFYKW